MPDTAAPKMVVHSFIASYILKLSADQANQAVLPCGANSKKWKSECQVSIMCQNLAVVSQHKLVIVPETMTVSMPCLARVSSSPVPWNMSYVCFRTTSSLSTRSSSGNSCQASEPILVKPGYG